MAGRGTKAGGLSAALGPALLAIVLTALGILLTLAVLHVSSADAVSAPTPWNGANPCHRTLRFGVPPQHIGERVIPG